jgi:hypothetical protein
MLISGVAGANLRACSPEGGPDISFRELPEAEQQIGHPLEILVEGDYGISEVSMLESLRGRSFVEVLDGRKAFRLYLNYRLNPNSEHFVVVQATNIKGATQCRAFYVSRPE